jgi:hypothetical protein
MAVGPDEPDFYFPGSIVKEADFSAQKVGEKTRPAGRANDDALSERLNLQTYLKKYANRFSSVRKWLHLRFLFPPEIADLPRRFGRAIRHKSGLEVSFAGASVYS